VRVSYTHGGGIDRPLALHKSGQGSLVPHQNWRGQFASGTCNAVGGNSSCGAVSWPGWNTNAYHAQASPPQSDNRRGSLVDGMRDASGQMYMRNRYYDPQTGQFTQSDPIGLAGGLNAFGFASGDPVSYFDPFGLCDKPKAQRGNDVGVCIEAYISARLLGAGNARGPQSDGGGYKTSIRFTINPGTGELTSRPEFSLGMTAGVIPGTGALAVGVPQSNGMGGWNVSVMGSARQSELPLLGNINFNLDIHVSRGGHVGVSGKHDGYPSYEVWSYPARGGTPKLVYHHDETNLLALYGRGDVQVGKGGGSGW